MRSVAKSTILDCIFEWVRTECRDCGLPVQSVLVRNPPVVQDGELTFPGSITDQCDICQRKNAPTESADTIAVELEACRVARLELLGERGIQSALGLRRSVTLFRITGYRHRGHRALDGPRDPRANMYVMQGRGDIPKTWRDAKAIGRYPPHQIYLPDASGFPGAAFVVIGADIWDPRFPNARVEMLPRTSRITDPFDFRIVDGDDLDALDRAELLHTAVAMFGAAEMAVTRGRKPGSGAKFQSREDCSKALYTTILNLCATGQRVSKAAIGRHIGRVYGPSHPDDDPNKLSDPGKNVGRWAREFEIDIDAMIESHRCEKRKPGH